MAGPPIRFSQLRWFHNLACAIGIIGGCVVIVLGVVRYEMPSGGWLIVVGGFAVLIAAMLMALVPLVLSIETALTRQMAELRELRQGIATQIASLKSIAENTALSDAAKSFTHRERELESMRAVIREGIRTQKWDTVLNLIGQMETRFGYKEEADTMRRELDNARGDAIRAKLAEAIEVVEGLFKTREWDRAQVEIDRLANALPGNTKVAGLVSRMKTLREEHKHELCAAWEEAIRRSDTDQAIDVLKELDQYLTPAEAHTLQSSARHVFKEKLLQLGVQFRFAVNERRWQDALSVGLELVRDFPNARMANEVRTALDTLRERAQEEPEAAKTAQN